MAERIKKGEVKVILSAGIREKVRDYFWQEIENLGLKPVLDKNIEILYDKDIQKYFAKFNKKLHKTDILWTKPSELSFYSGLGVPIIIAPPIGSQEDFNKYWLVVIGAGIPQENPKHTHEWIIDYLNNGWLAEAALQGYLEAPRNGVENIKKAVFGE